MLEYIEDEGKWLLAVHATECTSREKTTKIPLLQTKKPGPQETPPATAASRSLPVSHCQSTPPAFPVTLHALFHRAESLSEFIHPKIPYFHQSQTDYAYK